MRLHLQKLAVGTSDVPGFVERVEARRLSGAGMRIKTRSMPNRRDEIVGEGSLFWVVSGLLAVRQTVLDIEADRYEDGSPCARIELEPRLVAVVPRPVRPFQGWRYLEEAAAPRDVAAVGAVFDGLPSHLLSSLRALCLV